MMSNNKKMMRVGLTGGIGSGKSTVSKMLMKKGIKIIDADIIAREVFNIYPHIIDDIKVKFGSKFFDGNNALKRKEFGEYIFSKEEERNKYEQIIIPCIKKEIEKRFKLYENKEKICVLDAPTLIENDLHKDMDALLIVWIDEETQINRVMNRDDLKEEKAIKRINAQIPMSKKKKLADFVIDNRFDIKNTEKQLDTIICKLRMLWRNY